MKNFIKILLLSIVFFGFEIVKAETFVEVSYLSGEYISKKKDGKIHYLTLQYLKDSNGNIVYCLEPYTKFAEGKSYTTYEGDISGYKDLTEAQKRKISLIVYFGYGYASRTESKWYAVTQYLIWTTVTGDDGSVYFTDKLNGNKITKYEKGIKQVLDDVNNYDIKPSFVKNYEVDYGTNLLIEELSNTNYMVSSSDFKYDINSKGTNLLNIEQNGKITFNRLNNYYKNKVAIFDSKDSQDLIRPGNVNANSYTININVRVGNIELDIEKDDSVYTVESDFSNTCYEIFVGDEIYDSVCTSNDEMVYGSIDLPYGEYYVRQTSNGIGYLSDTEVYTVTIDANTPKPVVALYNKLIRNTITIDKKACRDNKCIAEKDAVFSILDKNGDLVKELITDEQGLSSIVLGYGSYSIKQERGLVDYSLADEYSERIVDEVSPHYKELFNNYLIKPEIPKEEPKPEPKPEPKEEIVYVEEEEIPDTYVDGNWFEDFIGALIDFLFKILEMLKN